MEKDLPDLQLYKNDLQEYTQKSALKFPVYYTTNEGLPHAPQFRSNVLVDGTTYASRLTFSHRKDAEQDAAKFALECIKEKLKVEECPTIYKDPRHCKSILQEFAVKNGLEAPKYITTDVDNKRPVYFSKLVFHGQIYEGVVAKSRKEAEQLAAQTAIQTLLGSESDSEVLRQIISSKAKLYSANVKAPSYRQNNSSEFWKPVESSQQLIDVPVSLPSLSNPQILSSTAGCRSTGPVESSWEAKRKLEDRNSGKKKMRSYC